MRPNIEEIREQHELAILNESDDDVSRFMSVFHSVPALIAYIDELENMPLVQTVVRLQEENERLFYALQQIKSFESDVDIYQRGAWFGDMQRIARQAIEGVNS